MAYPFAASSPLRLVIAFVGASLCRRILIVQGDRRDLVRYRPSSRVLTWVPIGNSERHPREVISVRYPPAE